MSLGGRDEPSLGVLVYGPDGTAYGSPAQARAAGVENPLNQPPVGVPVIPLGRAVTPLNPVLPRSDFEGLLLGPDLRVSNIQSAPQTIAPVIQPYTPAPQTIAPVIQQFNPMGEASSAVITYGPDGRAYGSPAQARNAGVSNPTMSPPVGVPISYPGRQPYTSAPMPYIPTPSSSGRNRYAEIMANYQQAQPFSFTGMPSTYTGGFNANPLTYTGGFTPYQRLVTPQPVLPVEGTTSATSGGGGGGRGMQEAPSAWSQMTPAERAAYYAANPTEGKIALGMQDLLGNATLMGQIGKYFGADGWYNSRLEKLGLNPESFAYGPPDPNFSSQAAAAARQEAQIAAVNAANAEGAGLVANPMSRDPAQAAQAQAAAQAAADAAETQSLLNRYPALVAPPAPAPSTDAGGLLTTLPPVPTTDTLIDEAGIGEFEAAQFAAAQAQARAQAEAQAAQAAREKAGREAARQAEANAAAAAAAQAAAQNYSNEGRNYGGGGGRGGEGGSSNSNPGDPGRGGGGAHLAKGGYVSMQHLGGPNPMGPDDGYAALKDGEYVINDKAVKKYGIELMNLINSGKISKGKLRGLLEM